MRITQKRFEELAFAAAAEILERLPPELRFDAEQVILDVAEWPTPEQLAGVEPDLTLYGLFQGVPLVERHADSILLAPDRITLFQGPLQAGARTETELKAQVNHTLIHELAHYFGRTDEELMERGLY
ncbi:MAG: metallopeptidase family protein [Chloroflexi bacterium]|nr:metallopeptidase family protein [Chloroflexota bacterium]